MLIWIFGEVESYKLFINNQKVTSGTMVLKNARVKWFLSIDRNKIPNNELKKGKTTYRSLKINNEEFEFSTGFNELHTKVYENILDNKGFGIKDAYSSIDIVEKLRFLKVSSLKEDYHPLAKQ
jgi:UDP-N-acetyl-2-amino-2-deoxyglucuronate dehydrogenase